MKNKRARSLAMFVLIPTLETSDEHYDDRWNATDTTVVTGFELERLDPPSQQASFSMGAGTTGKNTFRATQQMPTWNLSASHEYQTPSPR